MIAGVAIGAYNIYKLLKSKSLDSLKISELQLMEIKLHKKIDELNEEIKRIECTIKRLFEKARETTTKSEEISIANRINTLNQKKNMKQSAQIQLEKELRGLSNILILKQNERDLKEAGVWERLNKLTPEEIEKWFINQNLANRERQELIDCINSLSPLAMASVEHDEELDEILDIIKEVKKGDMEAKEASERVMKEPEEEN